MASNAEDASIWWCHHEKLAVTIQADTPKWCFINVNSTVVECTPIKTKNSFLGSVLYWQSYNNGLVNALEPTRQKCFKLFVAETLGAILQNWSSTEWVCIILWCHLRINRSTRCYGINMSHSNNRKFSVSGNRGLLWHGMSVRNTALTQISRNLVWL